ncbi:hypothetical protein CSB93_3706 [Pseudomonas paraeruginosa]|uniref:Uncharacterized protein n=1 Tax=Pseudomonas paraeruginosa TaxID=2994495 RepID=A0A2R3ITT6_9PSED|nr:hypothetical protein CSB93_3706 [Pseudomonas paraeruginosa]AWE94084.1 hypothetical protein CSC28_2489 [Pseudomonas paraeruginosa]
MNLTIAEIVNSLPEVAKRLMSSFTTPGTRDGRLTALKSS